MGVKVARNHFSSMMWIAREHCFKKESELPTGVSPSTRLFFSCTEPKSYSEEARWLRGVKDNIVRILFNKAMKNGENVDHSKDPVYYKQIFLICQILADNGFTFDNCFRKYYFTCLRMTGGRAAELSWLFLELFRWDPYFRQVFPKLRRKCTTHKTQSNVN